MNARSVMRRNTFDLRARSLVRGAALVATLSVTHAAAAQSPSERVAARHLMDDGDRYAESKQFAEALRVYAAAHAIMRVPTTGIEVARTYAALGKLVEAREAALDVSRMPVDGTEPKPFAAARKEATELAATLDKRIPVIRLELSGADPATLRASIDDRELPTKALAVPQRVNPGHHMVRVRAAGYEPVLRQVDAYEESTTTVNIALDSASASTSGPFGLPPLALGGFAAAAVGVTVGTITGLISLDKASEARTLCGPDSKNCEPSAASAIDSSKTYGWIATASFAVAIAGGALATYSLLSKPDSSRAGRKLDLVVSAGGGGVRGTF